MTSQLFWLLPTLLFIISYLWEPRRLVNAYLLIIAVQNIALTLAGFTILGVQQIIGGKTGAIALAFFALLIPISVFLSTAYLLFNGHQMMTFEGHRLTNLLSLLYGIGILITLGMHFLPIFSVIPRFVLLADFLLFYATFTYLAYILYGFWYNLFPILQVPDYIIVLGSGLFGDKVPPLLAQRLDKGIQLYEKFHKKPTIIVSGGHGTDELLAEADAMAQYLLAKGIPPEEILIENQSRTTFENLTFSKAIMEQRQTSSYYALVVTNSFHALRAGIYMKHLGIKGRSIGSRTALYFLPSAWIRETAGLVLFYWKWHALFLGMALLPWLLSFIR